MSYRSPFKTGLHLEAISNAFDSRGLGQLFKAATLGTATEWVMRQPVNLAEALGHGTTAFVKNDGLPALLGTGAVGLGMYGASTAVDQLKANLAGGGQGTYIPGGY